VAKHRGSDAAGDDQARKGDAGGPTLSARGRAKAAEREARLAEALRRNLRRRKQQARAVEGDHET